MESLTLFFVASVVLILTPGPDIIYVTTRGIAGGRSAGLISALGVTAGLLVHTLAASLGLAVLLKASLWGFWVLKIAGGLYLIYLGVQMARNTQALDLEAKGARCGLGRCFRQGFLTNLLNPKIALFFVAFLPQFVDPASSHYSLRMIGLGLTFAVMGLIFLSFLGLFAGLAGQWLRKNRRVASAIRWISASVMALLGIRLLVSQRG